MLPLLVLLAGVTAMVVNAQGYGPCTPFSGCVQPSGAYYPARYPQPQQQQPQQQQYQQYQSIYDTYVAPSPTIASRLQQPQDLSSLMSHVRQGHVAGIGGEATPESDDATTTTTTTAGPNENAIDDAAVEPVKKDERELFDELEKERERKKEEEAARLLKPSPPRPTPSIVKQHEPRFGPIPGGLTYIRPPTNTLAQQAYLGEVSPAAVYPPQTAYVRPQPFYYPPRPTYSYIPAQPQPQPVYRPQVSGCGAPVYPAPQPAIQPILPPPLPIPKPPPLPPPQQFIPIPQQPVLLTNGIPYVMAPPPLNDCCGRCGSPCHLRRRQMRTVVMRRRTKRSVAEKEQEVVVRGPEAACNSEPLKEIMLNGTSVTPQLSKRVIQSRAEKQLGGYYSVICSKV